MITIFENNSHHSWMEGGVAEAVWCAVAVILKLASLQKRDLVPLWKVTSLFQENSFLKREKPLAAVLICAPSCMGTVTKSWIMHSELPSINFFLIFTFQGRNWTYLWDRWELKNSWGFRTWLHNSTDWMQSPLVGLWASMSAWLFCCQWRLFPALSESLLGSPASLQEETRHTTPVKTSPSTSHICLMKSVLDLLGAKFHLCDVV